MILPEPAARVLSVPRPFVLLAGAGVSAALPACLPGWWELNGTILSTLFARLVAEAVVSEAERDSWLGELAGLRDDQRFPPDYQADFLHEEAGLDYFRALSVVDHEQPNPFHQFVAELASRGEIAAIITTNFDQMFEQALTRRGVAHAVAFDQRTFESILPSTNNASLPVHVLKVHGTAQHPESMIDTRKQRRRGRSHALMECVRRLLTGHPLVVAGFSGDDLDTDPEYLGIRAARELSPGLTWIAHPPRDGVEPLKQGASSLQAFYGTDRFELVVEDAAVVFAGLVGERFSSPHDDGERVVARRRLTSGLTSWAERLDLPVVTSMASALCEAAGMRPTAHRIVRRAWNRGVESDPVATSPTIVRFLRAHARVRLRRGRYDDRELGETVLRLAEFDDPLAEGFNLFRQVMVHLPGQDLSWVQELLPRIELRQRGEASGRVDATLLFAYAGTVTDLAMDCAGLLEDAIRTAQEDGDDVREALCSIELALRLIKVAEDTGRAAELVAFADRVGAGINDMRIASGVQLFNAFALVRSGRPGEAEALMSAAFRLAMSDELRLHMARAGLYWARLAAREGLHFEHAMHAVQQLNDEDLGPLESWSVLARTEWAVRGRESGAADMLAGVRQLASSIGLAWYSLEIERIQGLASEAGGPQRAPG